MMNRIHMMVVHAIAAMVVSFTASQAQAQECRKLQEVCVEPKETRLVSGIQITRDCWRYESTYECLKPNSVDYCAPLVQAAPVCYQTSSQCAETSFNGACIRETKTFRCTDPNTSQPVNTIKLDDSYIFVAKEPNMDACNVPAPPNGKPPAQDKNCTLAEKVCTAGPETRLIDGQPVYSACWQWEYKYVCIGDDWKERYCEDLKKDPACTYVGTKCVDWDDKNACTLKEDQYQCITQPGSSQTVMDCSTKSACVNGVCWETGSPADGDFANAVIAQEVGRQAGMYKTKDFKLFSGVAEACREGWGGLKQCCKESPGGKSNNDILMKAGFSAVQAVGKKAMNVGSKYMFDYMYSGTEWIQASAKSGAFAYNTVSGDIGAFQPTNYQPSVEMYGFGWSTGAAPSGATTFGNGFYFDPTSFAIAVAIQIVMELMSCEPKEQQLGMHRSSGLSHYVGSFCSQKQLGVCMQRSQAYCSYNSKLAKIISVQGRAQIGRSFGDPQNPDCSGFTVEDFSKIDFSKIDMSEFVDEIMGATTKPDGKGISDTIANKLSGKSSNNPNDNTPKLPFGYNTGTQPPKGP